MAEQLTPYQQDILIRTALGEARGEGAEGMADVIQVILNRANSGQFPNDPAKVALQDKQFSTWNAGKGGNNPQQFSPNSPLYQEAKRALDTVVSGSRPDPTGGALFYHAPSVKPSWSNSVNRNGTIERNGHVFYPNHPVPPGDIPQVASQLDTRRTAPNPASVNPLMAASRAMTSPTGGNAALQSALERVATAQRNRVTPASVDDRINARNMQFATPQPTTSDAARIAALSMGGNQTFAGQERMPSRVAPAPASVDDRINARNLSQTVVPQSFAGQERATVTPAAAPARLPEIASSPIGQAPATRTVQSVAVPNHPSPPQSFASMERATVTPVPKPLTNADLALNPIPVNPLAERLPSTPMAGARATAPAPVPGNFAVSTVLDTVNPAGRLMTAPGAGVNPLMAASRIAPIPAVRPAPILRQAAIAPRPKPVMRPLMGQSPLHITVSGANRISPTPIMGTSTGRAYMPGQQYTMGGNVYTANSNGSFTNDRTGSELRGSSSGGRSLVETPDGMQWR